MKRSLMALTSFVAGIVLVVSMAACLPPEGEITPATPTPVALECESWQVPGWIGEDGNPTSCVDNAPCDEARLGLPCPADIPAPVVPTPEDEPGIDPKPSCD